MTPALWKDKLRPNKGTHLSQVLWAGERHYKSSVSPCFLICSQMGVCPQCFGGGGTITTPVCSWSKLSSQHCPPNAFKARAWQRCRRCPHPNCTFECPRFFTSHLTVQLGKNTHTHTHKNKTQHLSEAFWEFPPHDPKRSWIFSASCDVWHPNCHIHSGPQMGRRMLLSTSCMPGTFLT